MNASTSDVLTTREAARMLGVALRTAQLWVESGVLRAWKTAGGHRRIARASVEELLRERAVALGEAPSGTPRTTGKPGRFKVLIVEDEPSLLAGYAQSLDGWQLPADLITATDGLEALIRIGETKPDLLVCDLSLPGIDGMRMIRRLRADPAYRQLQIVVVTALTRQDIADRGGLPSGVRVFARPMPAPELERLVRAGIGNGTRRQVAR